MRITSAPTVDGVLDETWWEQAVVSPGFVYGGSRPADNPTSLRAAFDGENLYLAALVRSPSAC